MSRTKNVNSLLLIFILIPLTAGAVSALFSGNMSLAYMDIYKPVFAPPGIVFPVIWTILYILMGISSYLIYKSNHPQKQDALKIYFAQLFLNFMWSIIFFGFSKYLAAFWWLLILILFILYMVYRFYKINKIAAYLQIPYLIWCVFAAILNFFIHQMN